jgi:CBS domain containing-hemolysin-like protein
MIVFSLVLLIVGVFLSAFFSGSETGFYRASRIRLVIANLEGDRIARYLLWLINHPALFVATTLIGNNVANYVTSLAMVLLTQSIFHSSFAEMIAPVVMSPLLFVYGELLPKNLFFQAPNRLLRLAGPIFLCFSILFSPAVALLWALSQLLEKVLGHSPDRVQLTLARKELARVFEEGQELGLLHPSQRLLGQHFSIFSSTPVSQACTPLSRVNALPKNSLQSEVQKLASKKQQPDVPIYGKNKADLVGYVRTIDVLMSPDTSVPINDVRPLLKINASELVGEALLQMQSKRETIACVVNRQGRAIGTLSMDQLTNPILQGQLGSLRR